MNSRRAFAGVFALAPFGYLLATGLAPQPKVSYADDVAPIFKAHCNSCHSGVDAAAKLDLSTAKSAMKGGVSGPVAVARKPDQSLLMKRILGLDGKPQMPMGLPALPNNQIEKIRAWIADGASIVGADISRHWAYVKPVRPKLPSVGNSKWPRNPIDRFVLAMMQSKGLHPSPPASRATLARRVYLDLIGIPPTPEQIDSFLADNRPDAYERLVDRLLASPHYGERQARPWLDLARYADSDGYEKDLNRSAWKYRDWVIDAFNKNMPYDRFTVQQLAGDLLPFKSYSQYVATGFNRNTMFNREGGVDQAEAHFNVVLDRVNTTATVWLGSTLQCARCHDHKYDPFTQRDYYKMSAYFGDSVIIPRGSAAIGEEKWFESEMQIPTGRQVAEKTELLDDIAAQTQRRDTAFSTLGPEFNRWKETAKAGLRWTPLVPTSAISQSGATVVAKPDASLLVSGKSVDTDTYVVEGAANLAKATAIRLEALPDPSFEDNGPGRAGNFVLTGFAVKINGAPTQLSYAYADFTQDGFDANRALAHDVNSGWAIHPQRGKPHSLIAVFDRPLAAGPNSKIEITLECRSPFQHHVLGHFRLSFTTDPAPDSGAISPEVKSALAATNPTQPQQDSIRAAYFSRTPSLEPFANAISKDRRALQKLDDEIPTALVMRDNPNKGPLTAYVHSRGEFLSPTEKVIAGTPAVFGPDNPKLPSNRLGLAEWIVSKNNPLTARVEVNRLWELYFGRGIVETSEDFGTQGTPPTHPELLDWLATKFMDLNWNMKAINRLIVTSATYMQSSNATLDLMKRDPQNLWLARGPRFRMEAEMLRDSALTAAGILNPQIGGPSVYPYQPAGTWDTPYNDEQWMTSKGKEGLRRGLYTFWKRSSPYPSFLAFDATSREECTVRRIRTNTPLQALAMLNDEAFFVAARALGVKMMRKSTSEPTRLTYGFRSCTGRRPTPTELTRLEALVAKLETRYRDDPAAAKKLGGTPEQDAYTLTANVLLNLDETLTKG